MTSSAEAGNQHDLKKGTTIKCCKNVSDNMPDVQVQVVLSRQLVNEYDIIIIIIIIILLYYYYIIILLLYYYYYIIIIILLLLYYYYIILLLHYITFIILFIIQRGKYFLSSF